MMTQLTLHLVTSTQEGTSRGEDDSDHALLSAFIQQPERVLEVAGGLRAALELTDEELLKLGAKKDEVARLRAAIALGSRFVESPLDRGETLDSPAATRRALSSRLRDLEHEVFVGLFLDNRHRILAYEELFRGSIAGANVYPREVVKRALALNAAALVCAHNHPSGVAEPSRNDRAITKRLQEALALVEVRLIDHFIIGDGQTMSFSERGWL